MSMPSKQVTIKSEKKLVTEALGFRLAVTIYIGQFDSLGQHKTFSDVSGLVQADEPHEIRIKGGLERDVLEMVVAHEVYHLFYSIRNLISVGEEIEAETFGELVKHIITICLS